MYTHARVYIKEKEKYKRYATDGKEREGRTAEKEAKREERKEKRKKKKYFWERWQSSLPMITLRDRSHVEAVMTFPLSKELKSTCAAFDFLTQ